MSNILIIKLGSLGDLIQANGAIKDIKERHPNSKVLLLTSELYSYFMSACPYIDGVLIDKRLPRWNIFYLLRLKKLLGNYNFTHIYDLQNSSRTYFYRKYILKKNTHWSSTEEALEPGQKKKDFDEEGVLKRMEVQLNKTGVTTKYIHNVDLSWAKEDVSRLLKKYTNGDYILIFPFCSKKHKNKKWPYFKDLVSKLKQHYKNKFTILTAPGPGEIEEAKSLNSKVVLIDEKPVNIGTLISLIEKARYIISNDTGPAHISSHLKKEGLLLFGSHTSPKRVSLGNSKLKTIKVEDLNQLDVNKVLSKVIESLN